jgi:alkylation response protein AidB-like acyl-CoA dehydrogenase
VRTLLQATGSDRFAEVFFDDVAVPVENRIGDEGQGWEIAMTTVAYERGPADSGFASHSKRILRQLADLMDDDAASLIGRCYVNAEIVRLHVLASLASRDPQVGPGPSSSIDKLLMIRAAQDLGHSVHELLGDRICVGLESDWFFEYLMSRAASIYGGTEQIQKSIVAQRILGLPRA